MGRTCAHAQSAAHDAAGIGGAEEHAAALLLLLLASCGAYLVVTSALDSIPHLQCLGYELDGDGRSVPAALKCYRQCALALRHLWCATATSDR